MKKVDGRLPPGFEPFLVRHLAAPTPQESARCQLPRLLDLLTLNGQVANSACFLNGAEFEEDLIDGLDEDGEDLGEEEVVFASKYAATRRRVGLRRCG